MKKVLAILLALSVLALSACAAKQANSDTQKDSNTAETEQQPDSAQTAETQQPAQEAKRIEPLAESLDLNALTDATVAASFGAEDISEKDGKTEITLTVYDYDVYDMVDISQLAVGDTTSWTARTWSLPPARTRMALLPSMEDSSRAVSI